MLAVDGGAVTAAAYIWRDWAFWCSLFLKASGNCAARPTTGMCGSAFAAKMKLCGKRDSLERDKRG